MILRYPRKARIRLVLLRNMRQRWARPRTARPWYRYRWREAKCRSYWRCGCFFPRVGRASGLGWSERVFRPNVERHERNRKWLWRRSIVRSRPVCALAACWRMPVMGLSAPFRQGLTARKLAWAVGIPRHLKVYPADVRMIWPVAKRGRPCQRHVPDILSIPAEDMLANAKWRTISWRTGTKGKLKARFAAVRVRVADGPPQRIRD